MIEPEIVNKVNELMQSGFELQPEQLQPQAQLKQDLGLDSLDAVDMLVYLEGQLGVKIEGERLLRVRTLQDVYELAAEAVEMSKRAVAQPSEQEQAERHEIDV